MRDAFATQTKKSLLYAIIVFASAQILLGSLGSACAGQTQPDPAGIATGDKNSAVDAAGNPFVVPEPADKRCV